MVQFGAHLTSDDLDTIYGPIALSGCKVYHSADQSIGSGAVILTFDSEEYDSDAYHNPSSNPTRLTIPMTGYYFVFGTVRWQAITASGTYLQHWLKLNGTATTPRGAITNVLSQVSNTDEPVVDFVWGPFNFTGTDYLELQVGHNRSGNTAVRTADTCFGAYFLGT